MNDIYTRYFPLPLHTYAHFNAIEQTHVGDQTQFRGEKEWVM